MSIVIPSILRWDFFSYLSIIDTDGPGALAGGFFIKSAAGILERHGTLNNFVTMETRVEIRQQEPDYIATLRNSRPYIPLNWREKMLMILEERQHLKTQIESESLANVLIELS